MWPNEDTCPWSIINFKTYLLATMVANNSGKSVLYPLITHSWKKMSQLEKGCADITLEVV